MKQCARLERGNTTQIDEDVKDALSRGGNLLELEQLFSRGRGVLDQVEVTLEGDDNVPPPSRVPSSAAGSSSRLIARTSDLMFSLFSREPLHQMACARNILTMVPELTPRSSVRPAHRETSSLATGDSRDVACGRLVATKVGSAPFSQPVGGGS